MNTIHAHIVSPNNYYADNLEFELKLSGYDVLNVYRLPEAKKENAVLKWGKEGKSHKVLLGPMFDMEIKAKHRTLDNITELAFIYERITEDSKRLALFYKEYVDKIYEGKLNIDISEKHYKKVYKLITYRYKDNYAAKDRKEIWKLFFDSKQ